MTRKLLISLLLTLLSASVFAQKGYVFSGTVTDASNGAPVEFATVVLEGTEQWAVADAQGKFSVRNVPAGKNRVTVSCLGYVSWSREIQISKDIPTFKISINPDNLSLEGAVVTAKEDANSATTTRTIDKTALDHVQLMNVSDISSLLPGGATSRSQALTSEQQFNIRAGTSESGNASFGTAVEVDGVRISNNASYTSLVSGSNSLKGVSTNNIASSNIESVEIITGVPSVEHGDMGSGVVVINTKKGKTPWMVTMSTSPNTKQISASKGFGLGTNEKGVPLGVINASVEHTNSFSQAMSPYTSYDRNQLSLNYLNLFNKGLFASSPLRFNIGITGNLGGMDTKADPDAMQGTWSKTKDNAVRANFTLNWLLSKSWITNIELDGSISYSDKSSRERTYNISSTNKTVLHGKEKGYFIAVPFTDPAPPVSYIDAGTWYNIMCDDDRPLSTRLTCKANWSTHVRKATNKLKAGVDWTADYNFGRGEYSEDMSTAPTFREYPYCDIPTMNNIAVYAEDNLMVPIGKGHWNLIAGVRSDNTFIEGSAYGLTSSLSPRFNSKYTIFSPAGRAKKTVRELSLRASWGIAVKLPSFAILFPLPTYRDERIFASTTNSLNQSFEAYYTEPRTVRYNPDLRWQRNRLCEFGAETNILGSKISLAAFWNRTFDSYYIAADYERTSYAFTPTESLSGVSIPADDRVFTIDRTTGVVTVSDKNGILPSQNLEYLTYQEFIRSDLPSNQDGVSDRYGLEWVVDFAPIKAINTKIRLDGTWYSYRGINESVIQYCPTTGKSTQDGIYKFPFVGYYAGGNSTSTGSENRALRTNLTFTTHIPRVRMIISMKLEASLVRYSRSLSELPDGTEAAKVLSDTKDILSTTGESIYAGDCYVVRYPEYYASYDDPTPRDYLQALKDAKGNDGLYNDLSVLAYKTSYLYTYRKDYISPYYSANFSVTKEIGDLASISFYANNFFVNTAQVWSTKTRSYNNSSNYIPKFYYGLTVRFKF